MTVMHDLPRQPRHDCPLILRTGRYGSWPECRCGWLGPVMTTPGGASVAWAEHVKEARRG